MIQKFPWTPQNIYSYLTNSYKTEFSLANMAILTTNRHKIIVIKNMTHKIFYTQLITFLSLRFAHISVDTHTSTHACFNRDRKIPRLINICIHDLHTFLSLLCYKLLTSFEMTFFTSMGDDLNTYLDIVINR